MNSKNNTKSIFSYYCHLFLYCVIYGGKYFQLSKKIQRVLGENRSNIIISDHSYIYHGQINLNLSKIIGQILGGYRAKSYDIFIVPQMLSSLEI